VQNFCKIFCTKNKGSVTAEFAVIMPVVVIVIGIILSVFAAVTTTIRCQNTANKVVEQLVAAQYAYNNMSAVDVPGLVYNGVNNKARWEVVPASPYIKVRIFSNVSIGPVQIIPIEVQAEAFGYIV
jgi:uncharacterized protein (UPF0333 family)